MNLVNLSFTEIQHFNNNLEAIKCLKKIELNNSIPLTSEIDLLKKYIGWGSLSKAIPNSDNNPLQTHFIHLMQSFQQCGI